MKKTKNRKTEHYSEFVVIGGEKLFINSRKKQGVYLEILEGFVRQLDIALSIHKRLMVYRFDLKVKQYSNNNKVMSNFINRTKQWIKRSYDIDNIGYVWVREHEQSKKLHYHLAIFLDGDKIRYPNKLFKKLKEMWKPHGHMPTIANPYYFIDKHNQFIVRGEVIYRVSYLAKIRAKGYRHPQTKDYGTSRLKAI